MKPGGAIRVLLLLALLALAPLTRAAAQSDLLEHPPAKPPIAAVLQGQQQDLETMKDFANLYYEDCMHGRSDYMLSLSREDFCTCSSAKIVESLTPADLEIMHDKDSPQRTATRQKIGVNVYAPCMADGLRDKTIYECMTDSRMRKTSANIRMVCNCMGDKIVESWWDNGGETIQSALKERDPPIDPFDLAYNYAGIPGLYKYYRDKCFYNVQYQYNR